MSKAHYQMMMVPHLCCCDVIWMINRDDHCSNLKVREICVLCLANVVRFPYFNRRNSLWYFVDDARKQTISIRSYLTFCLPLPVYLCCYYKYVYYTSMLLACMRALDNLIGPDQTEISLKGYGLFLIPVVGKLNWKQWKLIRHFFFSFFWELLFFCLL